MAASVIPVVVDIAAARVMWMYHEYRVGKTLAQGNVAKTNLLLTPVYENQQNILKAIKIENGGTLASQSEIINEVGKLMIND